MTEIKSSKKQAIILLFVAIIIGFLMIQPFNLICKYTNKCEPIIISSYLPKKTGQEDFRIIFEAKNSLEAINFVTTDKSIVARTGSNIKTYYEVSNFSDHDVEIRPMPYIFPVAAKKYVKFYDCLCSSKRKIRKGEVVRLPVLLRLDPAIENDENFDVVQALRIGYEIK